MEPVTDGALPVQMITQFFEDRPFVSRYEDKTLNITFPLLVLGSSLQQKQFFLISPL
jgi:hypothetical protein